MLKKIIQLVKGAKTSATTGANPQPLRLPKTKRPPKRQEISPQIHGINPRLIDKRAIELVETLQDAGFETYIVGGAVRDLLLGLTPKDFDIATEATPEEVKRLFRRAFIIGRRFRIVHVIFGGGRTHEIFEVSTFRANVSTSDATQIHGNERTHKTALEGITHAVDSSGRVLRDNVWGDIASDALRRDFTINAMYYDPCSEILVDYHLGLADIQNRIIRMIGDPASRYREDPVRIIRAVRFAAKLAKSGFVIESKTRAPITKLKTLLSDVPSSRMFDEMLKLVQTGHAQSSLQILQDLGLTQGVYPLLDLLVARAQTPMVRALLADTDARIQTGQSSTPSYLLAGVLWQDVLEGWRARAEGQAPYPNKIPVFPALAESVDAVFEERIGDVSGRGKLAAEMRELWLLQARFAKRTGGSPHTLVAHLRFRAGLDFLKLRSQAATELRQPDAAELAQLIDWWQAFQNADDAARLSLIAQVKPKSPQRKPKINDKKILPQSHAPQDPTTALETSSITDSTGAPAATLTSAPASTPNLKPKTRRRRKSPRTPATSEVPNESTTPTTPTTPTTSTASTASTAPTNVANHDHDLPRTGG